MSSEVLAYAGCGFVIVVYSWLRATTSVGLVFLILVYQMLGAAFWLGNPMAEHHGGVLVPSTISHLQLVTQALCCLLVRRPVADSAPNVSPSFSGFVVKSLAAVLIGIGISLTVHAAGGDPLADAGHDLRSIVIGLPPCLAAAFFRDHRGVDRRLPTWLRCAEECGCIMTMGLGLLVLYLAQLVPLPIDALHGWRLGVTMTFPVSLSIVIGACVRFRGPSAAPRAAGTSSGRDTSPFGASAPGWKRAEASSG